ncbi:MAG: sulfite exporter TauE/SafE family protein [Candidatus Eisenbacteria bacterium]
MTPDALLLSLGLLVVAFLYASVGHGGASGYLAVMALAGIAPAAMKPSALVLNLVVAGIGSVQFARAGHFHWRTFWPFALGSIPLAFLGGALHLPPGPYKALVGAILVFSALRLLFTASSAAESGAPLERDPPLALALPLGAVLGFVAGLTGVGGGIFLSPLLLLTGWARARRTAAVSAVFIFVNSLSGLLGHVASVAAIPGSVVLWAPVVALGGVLGARLGSRRLPDVSIRRLLAVVLVLAGAKLVLGG